MTSLTNTENPVFSVIINCFNSETFIKQTLNSVLSQTFKDFEIIVWDNVSSDRTIEIVQSFNDLRLNIYFSEAHTSLGLARNNAISKAKGRFIAFIDSDDLWHSSKLERYKIFLDNYPEGAILTSNSYLINSVSEVVGTIHKRLPAIKTSGLLLNYNLSLETIVVPRSVFFDFNIRFGDYSIIEEFDFIVYASKVFKIVYINELLSSWRLHDKQLSVTKEIEYPVEILKWCVKNATKFSPLVLSALKVKALINYGYILSKNNIDFNDSKIISRHLIFILKLLPYGIIIKIKNYLK